MEAGEGVGAVNQTKIVGTNPTRQCTSTECRMQDVVMFEHVSTASSNQKWIFEVIRDRTIGKDGRRNRDGGGHLGDQAHLH